ncbi:MAG: EF-P beta-lysylation protein EpmB [Fibrobacterota bacterium]|nr:EF-P beta-lysylation protein EpmB [Fibrobacterota bacterium]
MPVLPKASDAPAVSAGPTGSHLGATTWQKEMQEAFRNLGGLLKFLDLDPSEAPAAFGVEETDELLSRSGGYRTLPRTSGTLSADPGFPILIPKSFASRMAKGDWRDPLLLQVLPQARENAPMTGFKDDAVGDLASQIVPGLLHKYSSRALMMVSQQCAVHCRYCFRREYPYGDLPRGQAGWDEAWAYLESAEAIDEIILSGGDPLFLENRRLERILEKAASLPSIRTIRFHTRLPIVLPSRIEAGLVSMLRSVADRKTLVIVVHANHGNEIDAECAGALNALRAAGAMLLNQAVLLKDVNDDVDVLADLSRRLVACGTLPYYLHQLDRVTGTSHFEVPESRGRELIKGMRGKLPGYAVPRYVRETAGEPNKTPLSG